MKTKPPPPTELLNELLEYKPDTGELFWKLRDQTHFPSGFRLSSGNANMWNARYAGKPALACLSNRGYFCGRVKNTVLLAHRVIWKMVTGIEPEAIDHINGDTMDNRWLNLRSVSMETNARNRRMRADCRNDHPGVYRVQSKSKQWRSAINIDGKQRSLGTFATRDEAIAARMAAEDRHGYLRRA